MKLSIKTVGSAAPLLVGLLLFFQATAAYASVSYATSTADSNNGGGVQTTINGLPIRVSTSNNVMLVGIWSNARVQNIACTYNGASFTQVATTTYGNSFSSLGVWLFALSAPTTGSYFTPSCTYNSINSVTYMQTFVYSGVSQGGFANCLAAGSSCDATTTHNNTANTSFTNSITTATDKDWVFIWARNEVGDFTAGSNATIRSKTSGGDGIDGADTNGDVTPAGVLSQSMSWGGSDISGTIQISLVPQTQQSTVHTLFSQIKGVYIQKKGVMIQR